MPNQPYRKDDSLEKLPSLTIFGAGPRQPFTKQLNPGYNHNTDKIHSTRDSKIIATLPRFFNSVSNFCEVFNKLTIKLLKLDFT